MEIYEKKKIAVDSAVDYSELKKLGYKESYSNLSEDYFDGYYRREDKKVSNNFSN